jgi:hypothetical protein
VSQPSLWEDCNAYSLAQRYGSKARIFGRAHFCRSNGDFFPAIFLVVVEQLVMMEGSTFFEVAPPRTERLIEGQVQPIRARMKFQPFKWG